MFVLKEDFILIQLQSFSMLYSNIHYSLSKISDVYWIHRLRSEYFVQTENSES